MKRGIAWIRQHGKEYGADPSFIAVTGGSAGGHLTPLAALTPNDPDYQRGFEDADTSLQAAVPFYVIHGVNDTLVPTAQARAFVDQLREASDQAVAYSELSGAQHAFDIVPSVRSQHSVRGVDRFLRWAYDRWRGVPAADDAEMESQDPRDD